MFDCGEVCGSGWSRCVFSLVFRRWVAMLVDSLFALLGQLWSFAEEAAIWSLMLLACACPHFEDAWTSSASWNRPLIGLKFIRAAYILYDTSLSFARPYTRLGLPGRDAEWTVFLLSLCSPLRCHTRLVRAGQVVSCPLSAPSSPSLQCSTSPCCHHGRSA